MCVELLFRPVVTRPTVLTSLFVRASNRFVRLVNASVVRLSAKRKG